MSIQCKVTVLADSISSVTGKRMFTIEAEYPRIILAEVNTHRALGKNSASSRAIPVEKMIAQIRDNPAMPVRFGKANKGMQDAGEHYGQVMVYNGADWVGVCAEEAWHCAAEEASEVAEAFHKAGYAKQVCNRPLEPYQRMKSVISGTDWQNLFWLRDHEAADPTFMQLAQMIREAYENSTPVELKPGEWHVPYYNDGVWKPRHELATSIDDFTPSGKFVDVYGHSLEHALVISASCCAQVSFRSLDDTIEKARGVVAKLNLHGEDPNEPVHASPLEHQATPIERYTVDYTGGKNTINGLYSETWQKGITHMTRDGDLCSGNLNGWIQHRQLVPNHVKKG